MHPSPDVNRWIARARIAYQRSGQPAAIELRPLERGELQESALREPDPTAEVRKQQRPVAVLERIEHLRSGIQRAADPQRLGKMGHQRLAQQPLRFRVVRVRVGSVDREPLIGAGVLVRNLRDQRALPPEAASQLAHLGVLRRGEQHRRIELDGRAGVGEADRDHRILRVDLLPDPKELGIGFALVHVQHVECGFLHHTDSPE